MRFPTKTLLAASTAILFSPLAQAEFELTGYLKNETSVFITEGQTIGAGKTTFDNTNHAVGDILKSEFSARGFLNADLGENATVHAEVNLIFDSEGINSDYKGHNAYTQHDYLRELYIDTTVGDWDFRIGKQQVVWGTADGIKLLDIINPTDFRELVQNTSEDSRIPVIMINAEGSIGDNGNLQFILSEARGNFIPGLNGNGDQGQPFIMKGVDTITGQVNGFMNIAPNLGATAAQFQGFAAGAPLLGFLNAGGTLGDVGTPSPLPQGTQLGQVGGGLFTVQDFINGQTPFCQGGDPTNAETLAIVGALQAGVTPPPSGILGTTCAQMLNSIAQNFAQNQNKTNLVNPTFDAVVNPDSAFEVMPNATFATFDTFAGISTKYKKRTDDAVTEGNVGFRYRDTTAGGTNWSVNFLRSQGPNPSINLSWEDSAGNALNVAKVNTPGFDGNGDGTFDPNLGEFPPSPLTTIALLNADNTPFNAQAQGGAATLVFEETLDPVINIGTSFDTAFKTKALGAMVLRGEFLFQQDVMMPIVDRNELGIGNIAAGLVMQESDFFRYVLGLDITVATNLLISTQLIQFINLDYVDDETASNGSACSTQAHPFDPTGTPSPVHIANCGRYTADFPTLSLTNNLQAGDEVETFVSFFLSKPFGDSFQHRWNNIFIAENGGGYWNRADVEYSFSDFIIGTAEANFYFGDDDTQFGQFESSSNLQVGLKYLFQ